VEERKQGKVKTLKNLFLSLLLSCMYKFATFFFNSRLSIILHWVGWVVDWVFWVGGVTLIMKFNLYFTSCKQSKAKQVKSFFKVYRIRCHFQKGKAGK